MFATTLSQLESEVNKKCEEYENGIQPQYHPHLPQMRRLSLMCIQHLVNDASLYKVVDKKIQKQSGIANKLGDLLVFVGKDIEKNGQITFYHYLGVLTALSFHYAKMVEEESYKELNLADESQWDNLTWEACVWSLFYVAGTLFDSPLKKHNAIFENCPGGIDDISTFIKNKIKQ